MPNGDRVRWDSASPFPGRVPLNISFSTASGEGFTNASVTLRRPTDRTYPDLALLNRLRLIGETGTVGYDGRTQGVPVGETFNLDAEGWISHGRQRKFVEILIDRDLSHWNTLSNANRAALVAGGFAPITDGNVSDGLLRFEVSRLAQAGTSGATAAAQYQSLSNIGKVEFNGGAALSGSSWVILGATQASNAGTQTGFAIQIAPNGNYPLSVVPTADTYSATFRFYYAAAFTGDGPWRATAAPVVYGDHGLTLYDRADGLKGVLASDAIRYLAGTYAPKLDLSGIENTTYPIPHLFWGEPTDFADAAKQINGFHLWKFGVWENARVEFGPYDFAKADWQVRDGIGGVEVETTGDTTADIFNGCVVNYTNLNGDPSRLTPDNAAELRDDSDWIAANQWGERAWMEIDLSWIMSATDAATVGQIALAEANRAKRPSTITVPMHIQDIDGGWHPSWEVRADQTVAVMNQSSPTPRLITATEWSDHTLRISTDNTIDSLGAVQNRIATALAANGIGQT